jgi:hypothetical protein
VDLSEGGRRKEGSSWLGDGITATRGEGLHLPSNHNSKAMHKVVGRLLPHELFGRKGVSGSAVPSFDLSDSHIPCLPAVCS